MTTQPVEHADLEVEHADLEAEHADRLSAGPVPPAEAVTRLRIAGIFDDHDAGAVVTDLDDEALAVFESDWETSDTCRYAYRQAIEELVEGQP